MAGAGRSRDSGRDAPQDFPASASLDFSPSRAFLPFASDNLASGASDNLHPIFCFFGVACKWVSFQDVLSFGRREIAISTFFFSKLSALDTLSIEDNMSCLHYYNLSACLAIHPRTYPRSARSTQGYTSLYHELDYSLNTRLLSRRKCSALGGAGRPL